VRYGAYENHSDLRHSEVPLKRKKNKTLVKILGVAAVKYWGWQPLHLLRR